MTPSDILRELDETDAICRGIGDENAIKRAVANRPECGFPESSKLARVLYALPRLSRQMRLLLPFVQHKPGCDSSVNYVMGYGRCDCGLVAALEEAGREQ